MKQYLITICEPYGSSNFTNVLNRIKRLRNILRIDKKVYLVSYKNEIFKKDGFGDFITDSGSLDVFMVCINDVEWFSSFRDKVTRDKICNYLEVIKE